MAAGRKRRLLAASIAIFAALGIIGMVVSTRYPFGVRDCPIPPTSWYFGMLRMDGGVVLADVVTHPSDADLQPGLWTSPHGRWRAPTFWLRDDPLYQLLRDITNDHRGESSSPHELLQWFSRPHAIFVRFPLWPLPLSLLGLTAVLLWSSRTAPRADSRHCPCGYDLSATPPTSPCPECGRPRAG